MAAKIFDKGFTVWGVDQTAYGPVDLETLISWVKDERVTLETWVFAGEAGVWARAPEIPELKPLFQAQNGSAISAPARRAVPQKVEPQMLRRIHILAGMTDEQLQGLASFATAAKVPAGTVIVRQGERDDTLYLILEGQLRVRLGGCGREVSLTLLKTGDFFGDIAFLDRGPRSADVVAQTDSLVASITGTAFDELAKNSLDLAAPLLHALDQTLTSRIRADNARYVNALKTERAG